MRYIIEFIFIKKTVLISYPYMFVQIIVTLHVDLDSVIPSIPLNFSFNLTFCRGKQMRGPVMRAVSWLRKI